MYTLASSGAVNVETGEHNTRLLDKLSLFPASLMMEKNPGG